MSIDSAEVQPFGPDSFLSASSSRIGEGEIGGKAAGLVLASRIVEQRFDKASRFDVTVPRFTVIVTDVFDRFIKRNALASFAESDADDRVVADAFQRAELPADILGDLRRLSERVRFPLAVRSSSLLEDALDHPFAGVYETKMTPNNQPDPDERYRKLVEAIKLVYASTYFSSARNYILATHRSVADERMAVIIQEVVGSRHDERYYPDISGVCRSYNFYPVAGAGREKGVVSLALGLGKTIVDGGTCYSYSPSRPTTPPPFASPHDALKNSQTELWAVNVGRSPPYDPTAEAEFLISASLEDAEYDDTLKHVASTYVASSDRIVPGTGQSGPRLVNFAPVLSLRTYPLNDVLVELLEACEQELSEGVEIEFAATLPANSRSGQRPRLGFLQVRPMRVDLGEAAITAAELHDPALLVGSQRTMGNGTFEGIADVVYVKPEVFEARHTPAIARELEGLNRALLRDRRPYLLIGFGRWGSSDPWLGIPVLWGQISAARVIVEATLPGMMVEPSQGAHFFHNLTSFKVAYFTVSHARQPGIDWTWLDQQPAVTETEFLRWLRLDAPLSVRVDGRKGLGGVWRSSPGIGRVDPPGSPAARGRAGT